ncbi:non-functional pseudokinase ZED1-like [Mangifera indica]|uniref:non-functional pseudokinase ZED1-like n=1 Tax=Mangifera indica TaxID=29780 RepID=UPI001CF9947C|nr:non-functional pseudokinase ZED1-like [Mangifera indica]XP_044471830.1 non-functional pseudokinase ZED1-like [Mangifera indica]XP_044471839.1 non-functional pseudokinase ZED1-like [Mangifera indica]XP_044471848.1 non-functional pseudokinase ZED1-like [Mangifera indica]
MSCFLKASKRRNEEPFLRNGAILLEKLIASCNGKCNPIRGFSAEEMKTATNNYDPHNIIKEDSYFLLYRGSLQDRPVSVMKFFSRGLRDADQCSFNTIVFASQMRHKNILKLIGCCLESQVPILVFECVQRWTLDNSIYRSREPHLSLTHRFKVAMEIADAVAYLHCGFSRPIVCRTIKLSNIVFHGENIAKLFDFGLSISIPEGETHIEDRVVATCGYAAPEYVTTGKFNEKLDVYSFGALLLELLTGQRFLDGHRVDVDLEHFVKRYIEQNRFTEIVDPRIVDTGLSPEKEEQLKAFQELAFKCLYRSEVDRPTMVDVAKQLRKMYKSACQLMS